MGWRSSGEGIRGAVFKICYFKKQEKILGINLEMRNPRPTQNSEVVLA